jgi:hypothetical protein
VVSKEYHAQVRPLRVLGVGEHGSGPGRREHPGPKKRPPRTAAA